MLTGRRLGRTLRARCGLALALLAAVTLLGCRSEPVPRPPDIVLISIDTLRADHVGAWGYPKPTTPFLDSLARRGIRFQNAFAPASWTLPSHMSLFTGCYPQSHGVEQDRFALPAALATFPEVLKAHGYHTTAFITWTYLKSAFGFGRGFDEYHELLPPPDLQDSATHAATRAGEVVDRVAEWLDAWLDAWLDESIDGAPASPFFLFVHLFDPHMSYEPPLETARIFDPALANDDDGSYERLSAYIAGLHAQPVVPDPGLVERATALYDGEIRYVDDQLRRLFAALEAAGRLTNTLVVVVSDHGEELADHGSMEGHQWTLYDEVLRVPLLIVPPPSGVGAGAAVGRAEGRIVELTDVAPTILDLAGLPPLPHAEGRSLRPLIDGSATAWPEFALSQIRRFNKKVAVRTPKYKLIYTEDTGGNVFGIPIRPGFELYDLEHDPGEQVDIFDADSPIAKDLAARMQERLASRQHFATAPGPELSAEERERLRALGYVR